MAQQVSQALRIIDVVTKNVGSVWMNKQQCKRLADRFKAIDEMLKKLQNRLVGDASFDGSDSGVQYPAFDELLTVLKKGEAVVSEFKDFRNAIMAVLTRTNNQESFKEIHGEIDGLKEHFHFDDAYFETTTGDQRDGILISDAVEDQKELPARLHDLQVKRVQESSATVGQYAEVDLETVRLVVSEKIEATKNSTNFDAEDDLPSYLHIDPSTIQIGGPFRPLENLSTGDAALHGLALVHTGSWLGCNFAIKCFKSKESNWNRAQLQKEVGFLMKLQHPHIVQFMGFAHDEEKSYVLMELLHGDLRTKMLSRVGGSQPKPRRAFTGDQELDIITQIARGMHYLHKQGYIHGELKCSNMLVKEVDGYIHVKISDFHCARQLGEIASASRGKRATRQRPRWAAPEAIPDYSPADGEPSDDLLKKGDVYSFGMTCYEIVTGKLPFQDVFGSELVERIKAGERPELPSDSSALKALIERCWHPEPECRPTFEEICQILDGIRSSKPLITGTSYNIQRALIKIRQIPLIKSVITTLSSASRSEVPDAEVPVSKWTEHGGDQSNDLQNVTTGAIENLPKYLTIEPSALKLVDFIAKGSSAKVYKADWLGSIFAVKVLNSNVNVAALQHEVGFLMKLRHPHIVQFVGFSVRNQKCSIVMEFMSTDLRKLIDSRLQAKLREKDDPCSKSTRPFSTREALDIITKIALGMAFLHSKGVTHRDLKASNVLVEEHTESIDVKIVDFSVSQYIDSGDRSKGVGTHFWRAPEILQAMGDDAVVNGRPAAYDLKATDVYSFAMTCYEILSGKIPLDHLKRQDYAAVISGARPELPTDLDCPELVDLIAECWNGDPQRRPDFSKICGTLVGIPSPAAGVNI